MPVGIGLASGRASRPGAVRPARYAGPRGFHPGALRLAAAIPLLATLLLIARIAA